MAELTQRLALQFGSITDDMECASTTRGLIEALSASAFVDAPTQDTDARITFSPGVPVSGTPKMWVRTAAPTFVAVRENGEWVAYVGQGSLRLLSATEADLSSRSLRELTDSEKTAAGLLGRWARVEHSPIEGVTFR